MDGARKDLGMKSDVEAALSLIDVDGLSLVDVGCGAGKTARDLHAAGATVLGVEPDPIQAAKNRDAPPAPGLAFVEAHAERLPVPERSVDGVFFVRSLHHVPIDSMGAALAVAAGALKPEAGFLVVVEHSMEGTHFPLIRLFHDETRERNAAQEALRQFAAPLFRYAASYRYAQTVRYADFAAFVARALGQTFNDIRRERLETPEVRRLFEAGRSDAGDYAFAQPMLIDFFRAPKGD